MSESNMQIKLGNKLKELRAERGLNQEQFARSIDMDRSYYASIEEGRRNVTLPNLTKVTTGFGITLSELFERM